MLGPPHASIALAGLVAGLLALTGAGCMGPASPANSAVLLTVDTWRGDSFGAGGHPELRTPHLDRFFRGGRQFSEAFSPIPTTLPSHLSMLTGAWPPEHGVPRNVWQVPDDLATLPEILGRDGFATGAFVSSAALDGTTRIGRGFDVYDDRFAKENADDSWRPARLTLDRAARWWDETRGRKFLWVHLFEPHAPYRPGREDAQLYDTGFPGEATASVEWLRSLWPNPSAFTPELRAHLISLYHAEITGVDRALGSFLRRLAADGSTAVVLTSDHGEGLGERNLFFRHGPKVFRSDVRVPLVVRGPSVAPGLSSASVRTIDIPGTLLTLLAVAAALPPDADDLLRASNGSAEWPAFSVASAPNDAPPHLRPENGYLNERMPRAIRRGRVTFMETPWQDRRIWFDRVEDPAEHTPRRPVYDEPMSDLRAELDAWIRDARVTESALGVDPEFRARMRALGYLN